MGLTKYKRGGAAGNSPPRDTGGISSMCGVDYSLTHPTLIHWICADHCRKAVI